MTIQDSVLALFCLTGDDTSLSFSEIKTSLPAIPSLAIKAVLDEFLKEGELVSLYDGESFLPMAAYKRHERDLAKFICQKQE